MVQPTDRSNGLFDNALAAKRLGVAKHPHPAKEALQPPVMVDDREKNDFAVIWDFVDRMDFIAQQQRLKSLDAAAQGVL